MGSGAICAYDGDEGATRQQHLRSVLEQQGEELARLEIVFELLRSGTDQEATEALARLRLGESIEQLSRLFSDGPTQPAVPS